MTKSTNGVVVYCLAKITFPMVERTKFSFIFSYGQVAYLSPDKGNDWLNSVNSENVFGENYILLFTTYDKCNQKFCFAEWPLDSMQYLKFGAYFVRNIVLNLCDCFRN